MTGKNDFWSRVKINILLILKYRNTKSRRFLSCVKAPWNCVKPGGARLPIWMFFTEIALLFGRDECGLQVTDSVKTETALLNTLILCTVTNNELGSELSEEILRLCLSSCLNIHKLWIKDTRNCVWLNGLWDHFSKYLDSTFTIPGQSMEGYASLCKTPSSLLQSLKALTQQTQTSDSESWQIFIRILCSAVSQNERDWKFMKGRIYSKFHSKRMSQLTPLGLYHTVQLFLSISLVCDEQSVCTKLVDLLSDSKPTTPARLLKVFLGLFSGIQRLLMIDASVEYCARKASDMLEWTLKLSEKATGKDFDEVLSSYCDFFCEVMKSGKSLSFGQHFLVCDALSKFFTRGSRVERKWILVALESVLDLVPLNSKGNYPNTSVRRGIYHDHMIRSYDIFLLQPFSLFFIMFVLFLQVCRTWISSHQYGAVSEHRSGVRTWNQIHLKIYPRFVLALHYVLLFWRHM